MKPVLKKTLGLATLAFLLILVILVGSVLWIRWQTIGAWKEFKAHWEAQGEVFDMAAFVPAPIPDAENLALHPLFREHWVAGTPANLTFATLDVESLPGAPRKLPKTDRNLGLLADYSTWPGLSTDLNPADQTREILKQLAPIDEPLDQIAAALVERPGCQYPQEWDAVFSREMPQLGDQMRLAKAFQLRASLRLRAGQPTPATDDLLSLLRLGAAFGQDQSMISFLVELATLQIVLDGIWEGLQQNAFQDADLRHLETQLAALPSLPEKCLASLRFERASFLQLVDLLQNDPSKISPGAVANPSGILNLFWSANRLAGCEDLQEHLLAPGGTAVTRPTLEGAQRFDEHMDRRQVGLRKFTQTLALLATPVYSGIVERALRGEADLAHARLAIALERHHLAHGIFPTTLADLVPEFLPVLPEDQINHRPIEYRLTPHGAPLLYQWGGNGLDDRGTPREDLLHGDIVWQPAPATPLTREEYRRRD